MFWHIIGGAAAISVIVAFFAFVVWIGRTTAISTEEKGPMPKNHGGFGQRVTGGKS